MRPQWIVDTDTFTGQRALHDLRALEITPYTPKPLALSARQVHLMRTCGCGAGGTAVQSE